MKALQQFLLLIGLIFLCRVAGRLLGVPVPPTILAMIVLWALLETRVVKAHWFDSIQELLLKHIMLFLIPVSLSFVAVIQSLGGYWLQLIVTIVVATAVTFVVTAKTIDRLMGKEVRHAERNPVD